MRTWCRPNNFNEFAALTSGAPEDGLPTDVAVNPLHPASNPAKPIVDPPSGGAAHEAEV